ncbi:MAG: hypothetical protein AAF098_14310 [Pseudomonadota bacterium]
MRQRISFSKAKLWAAALVLAALVGAGCSGSGSDSSSNVSAPPAAPPASPPPTTPAEPTEPPPEPQGPPIATSSWIVLTPEQLADAMSPVEIGLRCNESEVPTTRSNLDDGRVVLNPSGQLLPENSLCLVESAGEAFLAFETLANTPAPAIIYDRSDPSILTPLPDDVFLITDTSSATRRVLFLDPPPEADAGATQLIVGGAARAASGADGWSPVGFVSIGLTAPVDSETLPGTVLESLDTLASAVWFDITENDPAYGRRVPFKIAQRNQTNPAAAGGEDRLILLPSVRLQPEHTYALIVTRRVLSETGAPLAPSAAFSASLAAAQALENDAVARVRELIEPTIESVNEVSPIPYDADDIALVLRMSIRSAAPLTADLESIVSLIDAEQFGDLNVSSIEEPRPGTPVKAVLRGTVELPNFNLPLLGGLARDLNGLPEKVDDVAVDFVLTLPNTSALAGGPPPLIIYQHGEPGSAEELIPIGRNEDSAGSSLTDLGYALIGFTVPQTVVPTPGNPGSSTEADPTFFQPSPLAEAELQNYAYVIAFAKLVESLSTGDVFPAGGDGVQDFTTSWLGYFGISAGANRGMAALPFLPEVDAGLLVVGGLRRSEILEFPGFISSDTEFDSIVQRGSPLTATALSAATPLREVTRDTSSVINYVPLQFATPVVLDSPRRADLLIVEGIDDTFAPNDGSRAVVGAYGPGVIQHVPTIQSSTEVLTEAPGPIFGNIAAGANTGGFAQFVPANPTAGVTTPGCSNINEGHFCPQGAPEAYDLYLRFFETSLLNGLAEIEVTE